MCQVAVSLYNMRQILDSTVTSTINTHTISLNLFLQIGSLWTYTQGYWYKIYPLLLPNNDSMPLSITLLSPAIIVLKLHSSWLINCFPGVVIFFFQKRDHDCQKKQDWQYRRFSAGIAVMHSLKYWYKEASMDCFLCFQNSLQLVPVSRCQCLCWPVCLFCHPSPSIHFDSCPMNHETKSILHSSCLSVFLSVFVHFITVSVTLSLFLSVHLSICLSICSRGDGHWALLWFHLLVWTCSCPPFCPSISSWLFWLSRKMDCLLFNPSHTCSEIRSDQFYHLAPFAQVRTYKIS